MSFTPSREWVAKACDVVDDDEQFDRLGKSIEMTVLFEFEDDQYVVSFEDGSATLDATSPRYVTWDVALRASASTWEKLLAETPPPLHHDILAAWLEAESLTIEGDLVSGVRAIPALKRVIDMFRSVEHDLDLDDTVDPESWNDGEHEAISGHYVWLDVHDESYRTFYEVAGNGDTPMVCLHTASGDTRQWRHVLNDVELLDELTIYAFDMPRHGNTYPPMSTDWWQRDYELTGDFFKDFIMKFIRTLDLNQPIVMGCSMAGKVVLELAIEYPDELEAVISLEGADDRPRTRDFGYLSRPDINQETVRPEWTYALVAPHSPEQYKRESWWIYSQGGDGVYVGDLPYSGSMDIREETPSIDTDQCGVYFLTGEYDFSTTPEETIEAADRIDGSYVEIMDGIGHFPQIENPDLFQGYLHPVIDQILK